MRVAVAVLVALLINGALFWLMGFMLRAEQGEVVRALPDALKVGFLQVQPAAEPPVPEPGRVPREPPEPPPPAAQTLASPVSPPSAAPPAWKTAEIALPLDLGDGPFLGEPSAVPAPALPDAPPPVVRVPPRYPRRALLRNVEGDVRVVFTINPDGTVSDPRVVSASPPGYFEQAALQAIRHWEFQPDPGGAPRTAAQNVHFKLSRKR